MLKSTWKENLKWKTEKMKKVLKFEIQNWFKMISHLADCWWSCRSYNRMYLTMYLKLYFNEVHEVNFSLYLTFHILWYIQRFSQNLTTPHFVEFVVFVVLVVHITYHHTLWYFEKIVTNCAQLCALKCAQIGHIGHMFYCAQLFIHCDIVILWYLFKGPSRTLGQMVCDHVSQFQTFLQVQHLNFITSTAIFVL